MHVLQQDFAVAKVPLLQDAVSSGVKLPEDSVQGAILSGFKTSLELVDPFWQLEMEGMGLWLENSLFPLCSMPDMVCVENLALVSPLSFGGL